MNTLLIVLAGIVLLLFLMVGLGLNAFLALIFTSLAVGVAEGMSAIEALASIQKGVGGTLQSIALILAFGAMLGKVVEESGAAQRITFGLLSLFGKARLQWALLVTGFIVGLPMIYNAGFLVLIPLVYSITATARLPLLYVGIPMAASLSIAHGLLPPHPAPTAIAAIFKADINLTLLYGFVLAIPALVLAGLWFSRFFKQSVANIPAHLFTYRERSEEEMPGLGVSLLSTLLPVAFMVLAALSSLTLPGHSLIRRGLNFLGDPTIALFVALLAGCYFLGVRRGETMKKMMETAARGAGSVAMVLLIIAGGGAFKQVLLDSGVGLEMEAISRNFTFSPLVLAWTVSALLRMAIGSATVAAITSAGIVLPIVTASPVAPELIVLSTGAGSLMFSHVNDIGFWMFKEYFNLSIRQTFLSWTIMETIVAIVGLVGCLLLNLLII